VFAKDHIDGVCARRSIGSTKVNGHIIEGVQEFPSSFELSDCKSMVALMAEEGITAVLPDMGIKSRANMSAVGQGRMNLG